MSLLHVMLKVNAFHYNGEHLLPPDSFHCVNHVNDTIWCRASILLVSESYTTTGSLGPLTPPTCVGWPSTSRQLSIHTLGRIATHSPVEMQAANAKPGHLHGKVCKQRIIMPQDASRIVIMHTIIVILSSPSSCCRDAKHTLNVSQLSA